MRASLCILAVLSVLCTGLAMGNASRGCGQPCRRQGL